MLWIRSSFLGPLEVRIATNICELVSRETKVEQTQTNTLISNNRAAKTKIDLSSVGVRLVSSAGFVTFEGAPDPNGYYIVPADVHVASQTLKIQAPEGWTFSTSCHFSNVNSTSQ